MNEILELKEKVAVLRNNLGEWREAYDKEKAWLDERIADLTKLWETKNAELIESFRESAQANGEAEHELREALVAHYEKTGNKTFDKQLSVRVNTKLIYPTGKALDWCKANAPFLIKEELDVKNFEQVAKAQNFDFVEVEEKVSAVISKEL